MPPKAKAGQEPKKEVRNLNAEAAVAAAGAIKRLKKLAKKMTVDNALQVLDMLQAADASKMYQHGAAVRKACILTLGKLTPDELAQAHTGTLIQSLEDRDDGVRQAAVQVMTTRLTADALASHCAPSGPPGQCGGCVQIKRLFSGLPLFG